MDQLHQIMVNSQSIVKTERDNGKCLYIVMFMFIYYFF